ncbi:MAG: lytic transglycosylase domain-containing protein [Cocleimonas sp.]|nr:lytic transglycosylase domain-containing protein [Cocleimonas sp.]
MDNINLDSSLVQQGSGEEVHKHLHQKSHKFSARLISFISAFLILLASVFAVNVSTINSVEAKSQSVQDKVKKKRYIKSRKSRRYKKSRKSRKGRKGKRYKARYKKSKRYRKRKGKSKRNRKSRKGKRLYKTSYKKSIRSKKSKKRYKKSRKKSKRGRRVRTCDQLSSSTLRRKARRYQKTISHAAKQHGVNQNFIKAVITVETCFRPGLRGTSGEKGLMQLMPATAKRFGVKNRFSSWENIHGGARYLSYLLRQFNGNKAYAAAGYNGGRGAVSKTRGPKFEAVRRYSRMVMNAYGKFKPRRIKAKSKKRKWKKRKKSRS